MIVAFLSVKEPPTYANIMVEHVQKAMPGIKICQLTDMDTPEVAGTIALRARNEFDSITVFKMWHLSRLDGDVLFLDTDVVVNKDMSHVFMLDFDVALTWRSEQIVDPVGTNVTEMMPYNTGVMFQHSGYFWGEAARWAKDKDIGWYADQIAAAALAPHFNVLKLHCDNFNYTPKKADEDLSNRYAVHYKGKSRRLMNERFGL